MWRAYRHCLFFAIHHQPDHNLVPLIPVVERASNKQRLFLLLVWNSHCNASSLALVVCTFLGVQNHCPAMNSEHYWIGAINDSLFEELERILACWLHNVSWLNIKFGWVQSRHFVYFAKLSISHSHPDSILSRWIQALNEPSSCIIFYLLEDLFSLHFEPDSILYFILVCMVGQMQESELNFVVGWIKLQGSWIEWILASLIKHLWRGLGW